MCANAKDEDSISADLKTTVFADNFEKDFMTNIFDDTYEFMRIGGQLNTNWDTADHHLRVNLLAEEVDEYLDGEDYQDPIEVADGLADIIVVAMGTLIAYFGRDKALRILAEVGASNLSKFVDDGFGNLVPVLRESDKKIMKGPGFRPPNPFGDY